MPGEVHGKLDCFVNSVPAKEVTHSVFKGLFDLLNSLTASGKVTRIAYNTGSNGSGTGYWDDPNPFGNNAWYCYRFNSSSVRTWDWYLLVQNASGSGNFGDSPGNPGLSNGIAQIQSYNEGTIAMAAAAMVTTGGVSVSPWNGTTNNNGEDNKGDPVWNSGSVGDVLRVLPRSNNSGGSHDASRENMAELFNSRSSTLSVRFHILIDDDGLAVFIDPGNNQNYACSYIGYYEPRTELTGAIETPLVMFVKDSTTADIVGENENYGSTTGDNSVWEGGIVARDNCRIGRIGRYSNSWQQDTNLQPNTQLDPGAFDVFSVPVIGYEAGGFGHVGYIVSSIYQEIYNTDSHNVNSDSSRAVFGDSITTAAVKIYTIWTGSIADPGTGSSRTGSQF